MCFDKCIDNTIGNHPTNTTVIRTEQWGLTFKQILLDQWHLFHSLFIIPTSYLAIAASDLGERSNAIKMTC